MLLTATGATIGHAIERPPRRPDADLGFYGLMALIGLYVGVIPVAIGMLWLPWLRTVDPRWMRFLLAFTVGLLAFLAIEALLEGTRARRARAPQALGGARAGLARRRRRLPGAGRAWTPGCAVARRAARAERPPALGRARRVAGRARDRPPQPRRGARDRLRLRDRVARARRRARRRLRPAQHHRGAGDRGAGGTLGHGPAAHAGPARR